MRSCPLLIPILALSLAALSGCGKTEREPLTGANGKPVVYASIPPLAALAEQIAGEEIEVRSLVGEGQDPHDFSPTPKQLVTLSGSAAFFVTGMPFEETLVDKLKEGARGLPIIDVTRGIEMHEFDCEHHHEHESEEAEGDDHDHAHHHELDPHIWLSPPLLQQQADAIIAALEEIVPEHAALFREKGEAVKAEIAGLHEELTETLKPLEGGRFYVYHGAFAYFADAYGLVQEAIETGGRKPEQKRIYALIESARDEGVKTIIVQPQFDPDSAGTIAEAIGGTVVSIDPMDPDLFGNLRKIAAAISPGQ